MSTCFRLISLSFLLFVLTSSLIQAQSAREYARTAEDFARQGNWPKTIQNLTLAISLEPANPQLYLKRAAAKSQLHLYDLAIEDYGLALERKPKDPQVLFSRGIERIKVGDFKKAIEDMDQVLLRDPNNGNAYFIRADAKYQAIEGNYAVPRPYSYFEIVGDYSQALRFKPSLAIALRQRGKARLDSAKSQSTLPPPSEFQAICQDWYEAADLEDPEAEVWIRKYCSNNVPPGTTEHLYLLAQEAKYRRNFLEAKALYRQIIAIKDLDSPFFFKTLEDLSQEELANKNYPRAISGYTNLITLSPALGLQTARYYYLRAYTLLQQKDYKAALNDYNKAITLGYSMSWIYYERGLVHEALGDNNAACEDWQEGESKGDARAAKKADANCKTGLFRK